jgi:hypothetical protein
VKYLDIAVTSPFTKACLDPAPAHKRFREEGIEINYPVRKLIAAESNGSGHDNLLEQAIIENEQSSQANR